MSSKTTFGLTIYINRTKQKKNGECPVMLRINIDGQRATIQLKRYLKPENWDANRYQMIGKTEEARVFNEYLNAVKMKAHKKYNELIHLYDDLTADMMRDAILGINASSPKMLLEIWQEYNDELQQLVGKEYSKGTYQKYITSYKRMQSFLQFHYHKTDIPVKNIDPHFISRFNLYLKTEMGCNYNTAIKFLQRFKKITNIAIQNGWLSSNPFNGFSLSSKEVERPYLTEQELNRLVNCQTKLDRINRVKDFFVFSCFTGLAYIDLKKLTKSEVEVNDGRYWIRKNRQKTGGRSNIPLLEIPMNIINKYSVFEALEDNDHVLPIPSNQKMNAYLKELADICNITKELTFHIARHTFATTVTMMNGVPMESVSKMLGHKTIKSTQIYARIVDQKVGEDMNILSRKLETRFSTAI